MSLKKEALRSAIPLFRLRHIDKPFSSLHFDSLISFSPLGFSFLALLCFYLFPSHYFYLLPFTFSTFSLISYTFFPTSYRCFFLTFDVLWS